METQDKLVDVTPPTAATAKDMDAELVSMRYRFLKSTEASPWTWLLSRPFEQGCKK
jgi:hypothetical protein